MTVTRKIEVGISSNLLHSIHVSTSICIRKCNKNRGSFFGHFSEKTMGYSTVILPVFELHVCTFTNPDFNLVIKLMDSPMVSVSGTFSN